MILKAFKNGKINSVKEVMGILISKAGFRINDSLYESILSAEREK
ncbi:MAG: DUF3368 domain-containing protein [Melioribacteraceae bacterium]|nr:DUF3368 domain-containing protein [Saprospiraceae bacterium]MCF8394804.1 DUF3368 domain-containing protein [Melioribacteraceae bacterium]